MIKLGDNIRIAFDDFQAKIEGLIDLKAGMEQRINDIQQGFVDAL